MSLLSFFFDKQPKSANNAKERLQIVIAHERVGRDGGHDFLPAMRQELMAVIQKYTEVDMNDIKISLDKDGDMEVLDVNIVLPDTKKATTQAA